MTTQNDGKKMAVKMGAVVTALLLVSIFTATAVQPAYADKEKKCGDWEDCCGDGEWDCCDASASAMWDCSYAVKPGTT